MRLLLETASFNGQRCRELLAAIGIDCNKVLGPVEHLSGGEKMRVALLAVSQQPGHSLLLLDEPDNHLDLDSKMILAQALKDYNGSFILISHDVVFAQDCAVNDQWLL